MKVRGGDGVASGVKQRHVQVEVGLVLVGAIRADRAAKSVSPAD